MYIRTTSTSSSLHDDNEKRYTIYARDLDDNDMERSVLKGVALSISSHLRPLLLAYPRLSLKVTYQHVLNVDCGVGVCYCRCQS